MAVQHKCKAGSSMKAVTVDGSLASTVCLPEWNSSLLLCNVKLIMFEFRQMPRE